MESEPEGDPAAHAGNECHAFGTDPVFQDFAAELVSVTPLRAATLAAWRQPETELVPLLLEQARLPAEQIRAVNRLAGQLAGAMRRRQKQSGRSGIAQHLLREYSLSSREGIALMCLAEALLRIPDNASRDALIRDKISQGRWQAHLGHSPSLFVNAATWGLLFTGRLLADNQRTDLGRVLNRVIAKGGEPLIRQGVELAIRLMGAQFVTGETIAAALRNARRLERQGFRYSYDMLGEAAMTEQDAQAYLVSYQRAIEAIGKASRGRGIYEGPGVSIKLSALHPRYGRPHFRRVMEELYPRLLNLTLLARQYDIGINIDAEESDRLPLSLDLLARLCFEPALQGWDGIGFVIQAYQKRCLRVIDELTDLAERSRHRLMVRLVKGAYWDSEIKKTQIDGLEDYPVFTRKAYTDISYLACARRLLAVPKLIYPQFATHNAQTLAAVYHAAGPDYYPGQYEFQCLHGMGETLYSQVVGPTGQGKLDRPCRIYAPVGRHETLLAYLVRRLLENGANSSFVHRIADPGLPLDILIADPVAEVLQSAESSGQIGLPHPAIPLPRQLYGGRRNAAGLDLADEHRLRLLAEALLQSEDWRAEPIIADPPRSANEPSSNRTDRQAQPSSEDAGWRPVDNPADPRDKVGVCRDATAENVRHAIEEATRWGAQWITVPAGDRMAMLVRAADLMEQRMPALIGLLTRESGKTYAAAIGEVRETVDFLRYYASQIQYISYGAAQPLGPVVCISPWNFPLSIFIGQIAAALAAGNPVLAKPAEQTPLIAAQGTKILLEAGIPIGALQLLPGAGETIGAALVGDPGIRGVMFTGSTAVARRLQRMLAARLNPDGHPVPLIAETGGLNAMIVDSSALCEQAVADIITSAFDSAGQRCSALRLLCLQEETAGRTLRMLLGAMQEYAFGDPRRLSTDMGPVIDNAARQGIEDHIAAMRAAGHPVWQAAGHQTKQGVRNLTGTFIPPTLIELNQVEDLTKEIFGPVLHVVRYRRDQLSPLIERINGNGYGLTLGLHSRIDTVSEQVIRQARAGNCYINRNIIGAVVGVQPFGGEGLSGTGPKAGGPLYLYRLLSRRPDDGMPASLQALGDPGADTPPNQPALPALINWAESRFGSEAAACYRRYGELSRAGCQWSLAGPTGEQNLYYLLPRQRVLCLADNDADRVMQLAALAAIGSSALWNATPETRSLYEELPLSVRQRVVLGYKDSDPVDAVLFHGDTTALLALCGKIADRPGPIIPVNGYKRGDTAIILDKLLIERSVSINTAAAGGNTALMALD